MIWAIVIAMPCILKEQATVAADPRQIQMIQRRIWTYIFDNSLVAYCYPLWFPFLDRLPERVVKSV